MQNKRRSFIKMLMAGTLAPLAIPSFAEAPYRDLLASADPNDEAFWELVKRQFAVPSNLMMMNAANLCPSPWQINELVTSMQKKLGEDVSFQFRAQFAAKRALSLEKLAGFVGVTKEEIGIVRNTTEANSIVVTGLELKPGDEVIIWDQNHASNGLAWEHRAKRMGFTVKKVTVSPSPQTIAELRAPFVNAVTPKTKLIAFSHISNLTGIALPAKEICQYARANGILTLVDGAQSLGMMNLNLADIGCDFYTASTHKWLLGPFENGVLYVRKEQLSRLWPATISAGYKDNPQTVDDKLCVLGQRNESTPVALPEAIDFQLALGKTVIENRVRRLTGYLRDRIQEKIPSAVFASPRQPEMNGGIITFKIPGKDMQDIYQKLYAVHGIACAPTSGLRISPHIYNTIDDLNRLVTALEALAA